MNYKQIITMLSAALLLSSCGIYTNYRRPESLPVDSLYRDVPKVMQDTASLADLSWRELFTDPLLVKWIETGLEKNSDLQTARLQTEQAQASLKASRLSFLPSVSLTPQGSLSSFGGAKPSKTYSLGDTAEWEIDAFGTLRNAKKGSRAAWEASRLDAESAVLSLEKQIHELENSFSTLIGIIPTGIERGNLLELSFKEELSVGVPVQLLGRRPDVRQAEWQLAQAFYATNEARSAFYPKITLSGSAGWTNNSGAGIANPGDWLLSAVGSLVQPLFNRGRNIANLKIAKAQQQQAQITFAQKLLDAGAEVNNALTEWQTARKNAELNRRKVETLETAVRSTQLLMEHGNTNYLEVLTAQQTLLQAQLAEVSDRYEEIQGVISLYHALGGGIK